MSPESSRHSSTLSCRRWRRAMRRPPNQKHKLSIACLDCNMFYVKFVLEARMTPVLVEEVEVDPGAQELITCINILLEPAVVAKLVNPSLNATYVNSLEHLRKTVGESPTK